MRKRTRRRLARAGLLVAVVGAAAGGLLGWLVFVYAERPGPGDGAEVELTLDPALGISALAEALYARGALTDPRAFRLYAHLRGAAGRLRSGNVLFRDSMCPRELLARAAVGFGATELRITVPEGYTRFDVAQRLGRWGICDMDAFLRATEDRTLLDALGIAAPTAEGYLFPDTYRLRDGTPPDAVVRRMYGAFRRRVGPLLLEHEAALARLESDLGFALWEVVTLASIVEKEAVVGDEQPLIAGVFLNRLRSETFSPRRLQADPTVAYGCLADPSLSSCRGFDGHRITRAMLADSKNRYNTYRHDGLPPGPVSNPGLGALRAVLAPASHDYLYFVARGQGRHRFSSTLEEHLRAVDSYRATSRASR